MEDQKKATLLHNVLAIIALTGGMMGMAGLYFFEIPATNLQPLLLALGVVLGWGGTIIAAEFGSSTEKTSKESVTSGAGKTAVPDELLLTQAIGATKPSQEGETKP